MKDDIKRRYVQLAISYTGVPACCIVCITFLLDLAVIWEITPGTLKQSDRIKVLD